MAPPRSREKRPRDNRGVLDDLVSHSRRLSCGVVLLTGTRELLLCHVTGQRHWDLPKGGIHADESPLQAALRETREETGLELAPGAALDLGRQVYTAKKDLHLFAFLSPRFDTRLLHCDSYYLERGSGRQRPEMDGFGWFAFGRIAHQCTAKMAALLTAQIDLDAVVDTLRQRAEPLAA